MPANLPVGRDLTIRRKIENGRYYCALEPIIESRHHVALNPRAPERTIRDHQAAVYVAAAENGGLATRPAPFKRFTSWKAGAKQMTCGGDRPRSFAPHLPFPMPLSRPHLQENPAMERVTTYSSLPRRPNNMTDIWPRRNES